MMLNLSAAVLLFSASCLCAAVAKEDFECAIAVERTSYKVGESPGFSLEIINKTGRNVILVVPLDGAESGMRYPKCQLDILDATGKPLKPRMRFRCGNMNLLRVEDFVAVPAGQAFRPYGEGFVPMLQYFPFDITVPGEYTFRFHYATSEHVWDYFGDERLGGGQTASPEIQRLFEHVPRLDLQSNDLKIRFVAKAGRL